MRDFSIQTYNKLLFALLRQGFEFQRYKDFHKNNENQKQIILRHDVDARKENSLQFAKIQHKMGIVGTYFFRIVPQSFDEKIIKEIAGLGHEIGYHYEEMSLAAQRQKAEGGGRMAWSLGRRAQSQETGSKKYEVVRWKYDADEYERYLAGIAIDNFKENLEKLRKIVPVKTICMHGSPRSRWDSRLLWKYYDYHNFGIVGEPYFDVNFEEVLYLTDTGRRWDGDLYNIRDKAEGGGRKAEEQRDLETKGLRDEENKKVGEEEKRRKGEEEKGRMGEKEKKYLTSGGLEKDISPSPPLPVSPSFHSTFDIIKAAEKGELPDKIMMTFHPQRWTDKPVPWVKELVWQNVKNVGKYFLIRWRD